METNLIGCTSSDDCNVFIKNSYCSTKNVCVCKDEHQFNKLRKECVHGKQYGEKCSTVLGNDCEQEYLSCSPFGFCTCALGYYFNPHRKPYCHAFQVNDHYRDNFGQCDNGFYWSPRRQRCVRAKPGQTGDVDVWLHDHHSMLRPRYSFFTFTIIIICLMIILKRRTRKPSILNPVPRVFNQSIVTNEINVGQQPQSRSPPVLVSRCLAPQRARELARLSRQQMERQQLQADAEFSLNAQPPPPYEESAVNFSSSTAAVTTTATTTLVNIGESPPSYEQAIKMQPLQQISNTQLNDSTQQSVAIYICPPAALSSTATGTTPASTTTTTTLVQPPLLTTTTTIMTTNQQPPATKTTTDLLEESKK